jgi:hypothetical protein
MARLVEDVLRRALGVIEKTATAAKPKLRVRFNPRRHLAMLIRLAEGGIAPPLRSGN